jgi:ribonucleoside-diphosphate reductase alpha chain
MRATDAWAATIRAGGRARRAAKMVVLDAWHPDILDFIEAKAREEDRGRALLAAGFPHEVVASLAFQHANHSVRVTDEFMRLAIEGGEDAASGHDRRGARDVSGPPSAVRLR